MIPNTKRRRPPGLSTTHHLLLLLLLLVLLVPNQSLSQPQQPPPPPNPPAVSARPWGIIVIVSPLPSISPRPSGWIAPPDIEEVTPSATPESADEMLESATPEVDVGVQPQITANGVEETPMSTEVSGTSGNTSGSEGNEQDGQDEGNGNSDEGAGKIVGEGTEDVKGSGGSSVGRRVGFGIGGSLLGLLILILLGVLVIRTRAERSRADYAMSSFVGDSRFSSSFLTNATTGRGGGYNMDDDDSDYESGRSVASGRTAREYRITKGGKHHADLETGVISASESPWDTRLDGRSGSPSLVDDDDVWSSSGDEAFPGEHGEHGKRRSVERVYDNMYTNTPEGTVSEVGSGTGVIGGGGSTGDGGVGVVMQGSERLPPAPVTTNWPVDTAIVVDCSNSVSPTTYAAIKRALTRQGGLIDTLATQARSTFRATFIQFADMSSLICPLTDDIQRLKSSINSATQTQSSLDGHGFGREVHLALNRCRKQLLPDYSQDEFEPQQRRFRRVLLVCCSGFTESGSSSTGFAASEAAKVLQDNDVAVVTVAIGYYCGPALRKLASGDPPAHLAVTEVGDFEGILPRVTRQLVGRCLRSERVE